MNNLKSILLFVGGIVIGGSAGVFGTKKYYQNKYQKQYEEDHNALEEYYKRADEYARVEHDEEIEENEPTKGNSRPGGRMDPEERARIKEQLVRNHEQTTNYAAMYRGNRVEIDPVDDAAESEHPKDQGEEGEEDPNYIVDERDNSYPKICKYCQYCKNDHCEMTDENVGEEDSCSDFTLSLHLYDETTPEEEAFDEHQKNKSKRPKIISAENYSNLPAHIDQEVLYFYALDEMLTDDNEEPIEDPEAIIGDSLTKYGFIDNDERIIFVMNYATDTCYEIQKVDASWTETH